MPGWKWISVGGVLFFVTKGAERLFYLTDHPVVNLWTLYALVLVLWWVVKEIKRTWGTEEKQ